MLPFARSTMCHLQKMAMLILASVRTMGGELMKTRKSRRRLSDGSSVSCLGCILTSPMRSKSMPTHRAVVN
uniref:Uncharacterized protein n=1 Tax=Arundo donax TaxID=35708 RepID=A0A0A8ZEY2_ARUDO